MFESAKLKVERAKHHINDFNRQLTDFLAEKPFKTVIRPDRKTGNRLLAIKEEKAIPIEFSLIIGDAVHNMRSALDLMMFSLIGDKAPRPKAVQFPFARSDGQPFESAIESRQIKAAGEKIERAIRELEPYGNGNVLLYGLHELDIADKHKLILTTGTTADLTANDAGKLDAMLSILRGPGILRFTDLKAGIMFNLPAPGQNRRERRAYRVTEQKTEFQPTFSICFGKALPFEGQLVTEVLAKLIGETERVINVITDAAR